MAVQHAEAPRGQHEQPGARKQDAHELDGQLALVALESRRDRGNQHRRREHADDDQDRDDERQERADGAGHPVGVLALAARDERRVHGMNDADSAPSPNRFCRKLGMRNAALKASAASD